MIALHAAWVMGADGSPGRLLLWGESTHPAAPPARRRGRRPRGWVPPHPFQAPRGELESLLGGLPGRPSGAAPGSLDLALPSSGGSPLPSPPMPREGPEAGGPSPSEWRVEGLSMGPAAAVRLLALLPAQPPPGCAFGADLAFWGRAARLALRLVAGQRFVPSAARDGPSLRGAWAPSLASPDDSRAFSELAQAMPPVCRSLAPGTLPARGLLLAFLGDAVDGCVRSWLEEASKGGGLEPVAARPERPEEAWAASLASRSPRPLKGADELAERLPLWLEDACRPPGSLRTCIRLDPPKDGSEGWALAYLLQSSEDPSLLVPASRVWGDAGGSLGPGGAEAQRPQDRLLKDLGRASRVFPPIGGSLRAARPRSCRLTVHEAYSFLRDASPALADLGMGVLVPPWWSAEGRRASLGLAARVGPKRGQPPPSAGGGSLTLGAVLELDLGVALGGEELGLEEFERIVALKVPLVRVRGQWVELDADKVGRMLELVKGGAAELAGSDALRLLAGAGEVAGLPVASVEARGWARELAESLASGERPEEGGQPAGLEGSLRPYQSRGLSWLSFLTRRGLGACLADDMGLGKTVQLIALLLAERERGALGGPALVVCPTSVAGNWRRELARFAPSLSVMVHHGAGRAAGGRLASEARRHDVVVTTYALARRDAAALSAVRWAAVVLDEAQNVKNPNALQSRAVRSLRADRRVALTGTPVENRLSELWSIMEFLNPGYLGSLHGFRESFSIPIERCGDAARAESLRRLTRPFVLRRLKTDRSVISDLPEKVESREACCLTREQATLYGAVAEELLSRVERADGIQRKGIVLSALTRLKQVCNHPAHFLGDGSRLEGRSGKLERLCEMLEEVVEEGAAALVFTQYREMGALLKEHLQDRFGREALLLHGGVGRAAREAMVDRFQREDGPPIFILSLKAGGTGLNLTRASYVFHFDRWWNPAVEDQATDRAFRIGQTRNVMVYKLVTSGTLEEKIDRMLEGKRALAGAVVGSGEGWLTELSTDELRRVVTLDREAALGE